jgi:prephenate dehydratase
VKIAFLGPHGTFTEEALLTQPDLAEQDLHPQRSVPDVIAAVEDGSADLGLVPIENSIEGSVTITLDALAFESDLLIQREIDLPISLALCARAATPLAAISRVLSHPMAAAQCRGWLREHLPHAEVRVADSNAEAVRNVAHSQRKGLAAIGTVRAASMYGLVVLAKDIEDHPENQTRFVVLGRGIPAPTGHDKTSVVCFQRADRPGSLLGILQEFAARSINLVKLESRPTKRSLGDYCFVIDAEGHIGDELMADALRNLSAKLARVKFLGSYPVGGPEQRSRARREEAAKAWRAAESWVSDLRAQIRIDPTAELDRPEQPGGGDPAGAGDVGHGS